MSADAAHALADMPFTLLDLQAQAQAKGKRGKGGRVAGALGYKPEHVIILWNLVRRDLPTGHDEWEIVRNDYNKATHENRSTDSVRDKFNDMWKAKKTTGNPKKNDLITEAQQIQADISLKNLSKNIGGRMRQQQHQPQPQPLPQQQPQPQHDMFDESPVSSPMSRTSTSTSTSTFTTTTTSTSASASPSANTMRKRKLDDAFVDLCDNINRSLARQEQAQAQAQAPAEISMLTSLVMQLSQQVTTLSNKLDQLQQPKQ